MAEIVTIGDATLYLGDCMDILKNIDSNSIDMILSDIPYGVVNRSDNGLRNLDKGNADIETFVLADAINQSIRLSNGSIYIFCGTEQVSEIRKTLIENNLSTRLGIWEKTNPSPMNGQHMWLSNIECCVYGKKSGATFNEHCKGTVWRFPTARGKLHPTAKPVPLMEYLIKSSSNIGNNIMDFTMGSGTTGVACINTKRKFIGIEKDRKYFDIACERINKAIEDQGMFA
jgi:site-specific DNA-methyltransferase (adenine-specific)